MSVLSRPKHAWDTRAYQRMRVVRYEAGELVVEFGDGARARVGVDALVLPNFPEPDWSRLSFDQYEIVVPTANGSFEIPWDRVRVLTDPAYAAHLRSMAAEQRRIVGAKIRALRETQGLSIEALAERAGISVATLSGIEAGAADASFSILERVLRPMGADLDALIVDPDHPE
jgi:DNA-binding XRE family transcriptional regulator